MDELERLDRLERYGAGVARALGLGRGARGDGSTLDGDGSPALLEAVQAGDRAAMKRFGEAFLRAQAELSRSAPAPPEKATEEEPAARPIPSHEPRLSIEMYASLRAACVDAEPEELERVRQRYGLDEAGDVIETAAWRLKFTDRALFETYRALYSITPFTRGAADILHSLRKPDDVDAKRPRPTDKRVWASVEKSARARSIVHSNSTT